MDRSAAQLSTPAGRHDFGPAWFIAWLLCCAPICVAQSPVTPTAPAPAPAPEVAEPQFALEARGAALAAAMDIEAIRRDLNQLAAPEMEGRRSGTGMEKARAFLHERFESLGLQPAGKDNSFARPILASEGKGAEEREVLGINLLGLIEGRDEKLRHEVIVLSAHYDHLGVRGEEVFAGADDNASGVAVMLELARVLTREGARPRRSVLIAAFDAEERGLLGSQFFVKEPTLPLERIVLDLNLDMLGRRMLDLVEDTLFIQGWEHSPALIELLRSAGSAEEVRMAFIATDVTGARSDFAPFLWSSKPAIFFTSSEHPDYHRPTDTPEKILWRDVHRRARVIARVLSALAEADARVPFADAAPHLVELESLRDLIDALLPHTEKLGLGAAETFGLKMLRARTSQLIEKGTFEAADREGVMKIVKQAMRALR